MGEVFSILCMGDSITAGSGGVSYSREFPLCITSPYEVENEGYPGAGSQYLRGRLELALDKRTYNIVCFMAGTNDLLQNPASDIIKWLQDSWDLALSRGSYVVALTLLEGRLNDDFHQNQKELNRLIKEAVAAKKDKRLSYYDANGAMPTQEARPDLWADQVHPSTPGYKFLGTGIGSYLDRLLGNIDPSRRKKRTLFRPCIDLHSGVVKQIVGGTLSEKSSEAGNLKTNWISEKPASYYAELYKKYNLLGGHVIMLGPNCTEAAESALKAWPGNLQIGGGINDANAKTWLAAGAEKVILTSWLFPNAVFSMERLVIISTLVGRDKLVVDLSCRLNQGRSGWTVAMNKWQTLTNLEITNKTLDLLQKYCSEFLIHAADVEGLQDGVDEHLVEYLGLWASSQTSRFQVTYAGGARSIEDLMKVEQLSKGYVDLTIGSALDIFGGNGATLDECVKWNNRD